VTQAQSVTGTTTRAASGEVHIDPRVERSRAVITSAATDLLMEGGVHAVTVDAVIARSGVARSTIYRHFPTRADLIIAVYRHQVEGLAQAGPDLLATEETPYAALRRWVSLFVDFLVTKHGLAAVLQSDDSCFGPLHAYFLERLVPVCTQLSDAAVSSGEIRSDVDALTLMRGVGNLCAGASGKYGYDARRLVDILITGLRQPPQA